MGAPYLPGSLPVEEGGFHLRSGRYSLVPLDAASDSVCFLSLHDNIPGVIPPHGVLVCKQHGDLQRGNQHLPHVPFAVLL